MIGNILAALIMSRSTPSRTYHNDQGAYVILGIVTAMVVAVMLLRFVPFIEWLWCGSLAALVVSMFACQATRGRSAWAGGFFGLSVLLAVVTGLAYMFDA